MGASARLGFASSAVSALSLLSADTSSSLESVLITTAASGAARTKRAAVNVSVAIAVSAKRSSPLAIAAAPLHRHKYIRRCTCQILTPRWYVKLIACDISVRDIV